MRKTTQLLSGAVGIVMTASNALAADGNSMDGWVEGLDPTIQPWAKLIVANLPLLFNAFIACMIIVSAILYEIEKKRGHSQQASEHKVSAQGVFITGVITWILVNLWMGFSGRFGF